MEIFTIGFAKKNLKTFIKKLQVAGIIKVIDIRLHNTSQLAGYAKKDDLEYILSLVGIGYEHHPELAPTEEIWTATRKRSSLGRIMKGNSRTSSFREIRFKV